MKENRKPCEDSDYDPTNIECIICCVGKKNTCSSSKKDNHWKK